MKNYEWLCMPFTSLGPGSRHEQVRLFMSGRDWVKPLQSRFQVCFCILYANYDFVHWFITPWWGEAVRPLSTFYIFVGHVVFFALCSDTFTIFAWFMCIIDSCQQKLLETANCSGDSLHKLQWLSEELKGRFEFLNTAQLASEKLRGQTYFLFCTPEHPVENLLWHQVKCWREARWC